MITGTMWKHMIGHAALQTAMLLWLTLTDSGNQFFGVEENGSRLHYTLVFNTFVALNVFNKVRFGASALMVPPLTGKRVLACS